MNKKPRATREPKKYRRLKVGERIRLTDEHWSYGDGPWLRNSKALDTSAGELWDPRIHVPMRRLVSPKGSAPAKPKPSQSHPQPRRPKK